MITNLVVRNFRSLRNATLDLCGRNVLIGPNKSGKTTLLDALRFLAQAVTGGDVTRPLNERGGMESIAWKGSDGTDRALHSRVRPSVALEFQLDGELNQDPDVARFSYYLAIAGDLRAQPVIRRETLDVTANDTKRRLIDMIDGDGVARRWDGTELFANPGDPKKPVLAYDIPGWEAGLLKAEITLWTFFDLIPQLAPATSNSAAAVAALDVHGSNLSSWLHTLQVNHPADFERISKLVREAFPEIESLGTIVTQAGTIFLTSREKFLQSPITVFEASAGQLKFIALTSLIYSPFGVPLICLEEPENHLHPRLLSLLVEMANQRRMELHGQVSQVIVTTHSPHLVDLLEPEDIVLVSKQDGETKFRRFASGEDLRHLMRESENTLGRLWFSGSLGDA